MQKQVIIHIGLSKTGSTFLQSKVFPFLENTFSITPPAATLEGTPLHFLFYQTVRPDRKKRLSNEEDRKAIFNYVSSLTSDNIILSNEHFSTVQFRYKSEYNCFEELKKIFPEAKIFLVLRKQDEWAQSAYNTTVRMPGRRKPLNELWQYNNNRFADDSKVRTINWYELVKEAYSYFGKENVFVTTYELFADEPKKFLSEFYNFFEIPPYYPEDYNKVNFKLKEIRVEPLNELYDIAIEKLPYKLQKVIKKNSKFIKKFIGKLYRYTYHIEFFTPQQKQQILDIYSESNKKLAELVGIDLSKYGYYVE